MGTLFVQFPKIYKNIQKAVQLQLQNFHFYIRFYFLFNHLCKIIIINIIQDDDGYYLFEELFNLCLI